MGRSRRAQVAGPVLLRRYFQKRKVLIATLPRHSVYLLAYFWNTVKHSLSADNFGFGKLKVCSVLPNSSAVVQE